MLKVKIGRTQTEEKNRKVESAVISFVEKKAKIDALTKELNEEKAILTQEAREILEDNDATVVTFGVDEDNVKVTFAYDVKVIDDEALKEQLGRRYKDLVTIKTEVKPVAKLKEMALEDDSLKDCLQVKEKTPTVAIVK